MRERESPQYLGEYVNLVTQATPLHFDLYCHVLIPFILPTHGIRDARRDLVAGEGIVCGGVMSDAVC